MKIFKVQSLSTIVRRSFTSPSISATQAILARPSLMSFAMSMTAIGCAYSLKEPSFNVTFMFILLFLLEKFRAAEIFYSCFFSVKISREPWLVIPRFQFPV